MDEQMLGLYVVMRGDLSSVLSNEAGWIVYSSFKAAVKTAQNFCGVATPFGEAEEIIRSSGSTHKGQSVAATAFGPLPKTNIAKLEMSARSFSALRRADLTDLGEIAKKTKRELLKIKGFGRRSCNEIIGILDDFGMNLQN
jgi:DNA-directed RNA polymerase alpha subunit